MKVKRKCWLIILAILSIKGITAPTLSRLKSVNSENREKVTFMKKLFLFILILHARSLYAQTFVRSELSTALTTPWEITYGPDNYLWITESGGRVSRVDPSDGTKTVVFTADDYFGGDPLENSALCPTLGIGAGTLGLTLHPHFMDPATSFIYFVYSYNSGTAGAPATKFRIKRLTWDAGSSMVISDTNIVDSITTGYDHLGGRLMAIEQNNTSYLFLSVGDNGVSEQNMPGCYSPQSDNPNNYVQDITTQNGKIHRFNMDGSIPADNPVSGNSFYTRGHRNPQGLMYNPNLDIIYDIEHGDRTDDEINILYKGMNYGWKDVRGYHGDNSFPGEDTYVANYTPEPLVANDSLVQPFYAWCTTPPSSSVWTDWCTVAPSGGIYYGSSGIPEWQNSLLVVTLKDGLTTDREVFQFKLQANGALVPSTAEDPNPEKFFGSDQGLNGRLRDIAVSPDGKTLYLINNGGASSDKITVYTHVSNVEEGEISIYPNPVTDVISIYGLGDSSPEDIRITNMQGQLISCEVDSDYKILVSRLAGGVYFIEFTVGEDAYCFKFVKV